MLSHRAKRFLIMKYLEGAEISEAQRTASDVAAYVCEHKGATIPIPENLKLSTIKGN